MDLSKLRPALIFGGIGVAAFVLAMVLFEGCALTPNQAPVTPDYPAGVDIVEAYPDASPEAVASPCGKACANIARLGCPEGAKRANGATCYQACVHMVRLRRVPIACWSAADSVDHLRACGPDIRCIP